MQIRKRETSSLDERKRLRRKPVEEDSKYAKAHLEQLIEAGAAGIELEIAQSEYDRARLELDSFDFERDVTGAWKGDRWGGDVKSLYDRLENPDGSVDRAKAEKMHMIQVNMGELDRLNKIGGHELGDKALGETCQRIYQMIESRLRAAYEARGIPQKEGDLVVEKQFDVYRQTGSNDFAIILHDADDGLAEEIRQEIAGELPVEGQPPGKGAPLVATHLKMTDVADYWNANRTGLAVSNPGRAFVDAVKEHAQIDSDIAKIDNRVKRILTLDPADAKVFYEEFLKKSLGKLFEPDPNVPLMSYEAFRKALTGAQNKYLELAIGQAMDEFRNRQKESKHFTQTLSRYVLDNWSKQHEPIQTEELYKRLEAEYIPTGELEPVAEDKGKSFLDNLPSTSGESRLAELHTEKERLKAMHEGQPDDRLLEARYRLAEARLKNEGVKRNKGSGLYERGVLFKDMEDLLAKGEPVSVMAIDMAFLKYFNFEGGRKTGDVAIQYSARIMEEAARSVLHNTEYRVCRTGGDEFMIMVKSADPSMLQELQAKIHGLSQAEGAEIPCVDETRTSSYRKERLNFNYGLHSAIDLGSFRQELMEAGFRLKADPKDKAACAKEAADYMVRIADRQIEIEKTIRRFMFLVNRLYQEETEGKPRGNYASLESYSLKAIGEKEGPAMIRAWKDKLMAKTGPGKKADIRELEGEITKYVIDRGWQELADMENKGDFVDRLLEAEVRERFLRQRIVEMETEIHSLKVELERATHNQEALTKRIGELEEEIKTVGQLRASIGSSRG